MSAEDEAVVVGRRMTTQRRENLEYLVRTHGSQKAFADAVPSAGITQPMISLMLSRKRRWLSTHEARRIEADLKIPENWMDRYPLAEVWRMWRRFRELPPETIALFNEMLEFTESRKR
jgi:hypothetical protein